MNPFKISFIIAIVDRDRDLQQCIASIEKAHESKQDIPIEILVVIQKASRKKKILTRYPKITMFFYIDKIGLSVARNVAIAKSRGDYLVFLDDDAAVKEDFIDVLSKSVTRYNEVNAFCGRLMDPVRQVPFSVLFNNSNAQELRWSDYQYFMGSAHVLSRKVIEKIGVYDERFGVGAEYYASEESDIFFRLKAVYEKIIYLPELTFYHPVICAPPDYLYKYAYAFGAVLVKSCMNDKRRFYIYCFIISKMAAKLFIRVMQKSLLNGKYKEKDEKYPYSSVLKGFYKGITGYISNNYLVKKERIFKNA